MPNIPPQPKVDQIIWFETHIPLWQAAPASFGITAAQVTALSTFVTKARQSYNDAQTARENSKAATTSESSQVATMLVQGRALVNIMKSFIENAHNEALWGQAGLEPDAGPGTAPDPTAPYALAATLDSLGNVIIKWKTSQPAGVSGVIYSVRRSIGSGAYVLLDSVGGKMYTDETVPVGTQVLSYTIKAKRGEQSSPWSEALMIRFGRVGGGGLSITSTESAPLDAENMKMAA